MVNNVQGWEIDFWSLDLSEIQSAPENSFISCPIYGHANNAFRLCITPSTLDVDHFMISIIPLELLIKIGGYVLIIWPKAAVVSNRIVHGQQDFPTDPRRCGWSAIHLMPSTLQ